MVTEQQRECRLQLAGGMLALALERGGLLLQGLRNGTSLPQKKQWRVGKIKQHEAAADGGVTMLLPAGEWMSWQKNVGQRDM